MFMTSFSETADAEITARALQSVNKTARYREQTAPCAFELLSRHLVLQAYCLTDVDEINPLGIEIWYRTTRRFSILCGIEAIRSVPKKYRTRYPALVTSMRE